MRTAADVRALSGWTADWSGLRVAVLGLGVTGFSVADTLAELGAVVTVLATRAEPERVDLLEVIGATLVVCDLAIDGPAELDRLGVELVVASPGFAPTHPLIEHVESLGLPLWGDVELAWRLRDKPTEAADGPAEWIAVTGTNGKTTTVQLAEAMIAAGGRRVIACGNVGVPVLDAIRDPLGFDVLVVELSSFQLHYTDSMSPLSSVCLNLGADHYDWHGSAASYAQAKAKVYANTRLACVYNRDDEQTRTMVEQAEVVDGCRAIGFGLGVPGPSDFGIVDDILCDRAFLDQRFTSAIEIATIDRLEAVGLGSTHMVANVLAAAALARSVAVTPEDIRSALDGFVLDHHRTEVIANASGIQWINDSKATNAHAAEAAIDAHESVVWIVGGLLKGVDLGALVASVGSRIRAAVIIGVERDDVREAFRRHAPEVPLFEVETADTGDVMPVAVRLSAEVAEPGDAVLLAPAAASMDQFNDYADRGRRFAAAVHEMLGDRPDDDQHSSRAEAD